MQSTTTAIIQLDTVNINAKGLESNEKNLRKCSFKSIEMQQLLQINVRS